MSESGPETGEIRDEDLPEDLQPGEENPLAEPLEEDVDRDELDIRGGKAPEESGDEERGDDAGGRTGEQGSDGEGGHGDEDGQ